MNKYYAPLILILAVSACTELDEYFSAGHAALTAAQEVNYGIIERYCSSTPENQALMAKVSGTVGVDLTEIDCNP